MSVTSHKSFNVGGRKVSRCPVRRLRRRAGVEEKGVHAFRRAAAAQMKRLGVRDSDILEVMGWKVVTMLRRYTAAVAGELAQAAHSRFSPGDVLNTHQTARRDDARVYVYGRSQSC